MNPVRGRANTTWVAGYGMDAGYLAELGAQWQQMRRTELFPLHPHRTLGALLA